MICMFRLLTAMMVVLFAGGPSHAQEGDPYLQKLLGELQATNDPDRQWRLLEKMSADGGKSPEFALAISPFLTSANERVRRHALQALESFEADLELVRPALKDKSEYVRVTAAKVLVSLGIAPNELHELLRDPSPFVREKVGQLLIREGIDRLRVNRLLQDPAASVRARIACALIQRGELLADFETMLGDPMPEVRSEVAIAMLEAGAEPDQFNQMLDDPEIRSKPDLAVGLLQAGSTRIADCLLVIGESVETLDWMQQRLFNAAGKKTCEEIAPKLAAWVLSSDERTREVGLECLHQLPMVSNTAAANITSILRDGSPSAAYEVIPFVEDFEKHQQAKALRTALNREEPKVRRQALKFATAELLPDIRKLLDDQDVRLAAATAVARLDKNDQQCVQVMAECLNPIDAQSTEEVCRALHTTGKRVLAVRELLWRTRKAPQTQEREIHPVLVAISGAGDQAPKVIVEWLHRSRDDEAFTEKILNHIYYGYEPGDESQHAFGEPIVDVITQTKDNDMFSLAVQTLARTDGLEHPARLKSALGRGCDYCVTDCLARSTKDKQSARDLLLPLLESSDAARFYACLALGQLGGANDKVAETLAEILPHRGAFNHSEEDVEKLIARLGPAGKRVMPRLIEVLGTDDFDAFPLNAFLSTGTDPIPHLKAGIVGDHAQYRIGCALRAAEFRDAPDAQRRELISALMQFIDSLDLETIGNSDYARPDLWEALNALSQLHPDESVVPRMIEILRRLPHSNLSGHAAKVLGAVGPPAKGSIKHLMRLHIGWVGSRETHIARAISTIESGSLGLTRIKHCLRLVRTEEVYKDWEQVEQFMDAVAELGPRGVVLKDDLVAIVNSELMETKRRIHAAYALARLFPNDPQWISTLESLDKRRSVTFWARYRLDQLKSRQLGSSQLTD